MGCSLKTPKPAGELPPIDSGPTAVFWESKIGLQLARTIHDTPVDRSPAGPTFFYPPSCGRDFEESSRYTDQLEESLHTTDLEPPSAESRDDLQVLSTQVAFVGDARHTGLCLSLGPNDNCESPLSVVARCLPHSSPSHKAKPETKRCRRLHNPQQNNSPRSRRLDCFDSPLSRARLKVNFVDEDNVTLADSPLHWDPGLPPSPVLQKSNLHSLPDEDRFLETIMTPDFND